MGARTSMYIRNYVVGLPGFEPGTSASRTQRATKLRYSPRRVTPQPDNPSRRARPGHKALFAGLRSHDGFVVLNDDFRDAALGDRLDSETPVSLGIDGTSSRDLARQVQDVASESDEFPFGDHQSESSFDLVNVSLAIDQPAARSNLHNGGLVVLVELVTEVAHKLFEDVANGDDARNTAVLVEHEGEGAALLAHLLQALEEIKRLGQHQGTTNLASDLIRRRQRHADGSLGGGGAKEVVDEEHTFDFVEVAFDHRETRVAGVAHGFGDGFRGEGTGQEQHVNARRHNVA